MTNQNETDGNITKINHKQCHNCG